MQLHRVRIMDDDVWINHLMADKKFEIFPGDSVEVDDFVEYEYLQHRFLRPILHYERVAGMTIVSLGPIPMIYCRAEVLVDYGADEVKSAILYSTGDLRLIALDRVKEQMIRVVYEEGAVPTHVFSSRVKLSRVFIHRYPGGLNLGA